MREPKQNSGNMQNKVGNRKPSGFDRSDGLKCFWLERPIGR